MCFYLFLYAIINSIKFGWYVFQPKDSVKTLAEMTDEERIHRKDGHSSAKEQFIEWYKKNYRKEKQFVKR